jgi:carbon-monoxide dehydrogenase medium subunit
MFEFVYVKPKSLAEASAFIAGNPDAKLLAGGMTLIPTLKQRLAQPSHLVDIGDLSELRGVEARDGSLRVGAATRHYDIATSEVVKQALPALAALAHVIGDPQVRNRGTLGGSIANNDPAADYPAAVLALGATVVTTKREIPADEFFQGMFTTALEEGEIVTRLIFPIPKRAAYEKFAHPASGYAMAGVFIAETSSGVRVAVTGAGPGVFRWTEAEAALVRPLAVEALEGLALNADDMNEDFHATRAYRANLAQVMAKRALQKLLSARHPPDLIQSPNPERSL